jgi:hypothetical protein
MFDFIASEIGLLEAKGWGCLFYMFKYSLKYSNYDKVVINAGRGEDGEGRGWVVKYS